MSLADRLLPTRAQLDAATAKTAAVLADPRNGRAQREHAELQAEAELQAGT